MNVRKVKSKPACVAEVLPDGLPAAGYVREGQVIKAGGGPLPISKSLFWQLVNERAVPRLRISPRVTIFLVGDIRRAFLGGE